MYNSSEFKINLEEFNNNLVQKQRDNGDKFYCLKDDAPQWMDNVIMKVHGVDDRLPNDFIYRTIAELTCSLKEVLDYNEEITDDNLHETIDSQVDIYTHSLNTWASEFGYYVDEQMQEYTPDSHSALLMCAQYKHISALAYKLLEEIENVG